MRKRWGLTAALLALAGPVAAAPLDGVWTGTYVCAQGVTALDLFIATRPGAAPSALFHFGDGSPARPEGCFAMQGAVNPGALAFTATHWLLRPDGYVTVNLLGSVGAGGVYAGWVDGPGCTSFTLQRRAAAPLPKACRDRGAPVS
jgi:hypothetical protein